MTAVTLLLILLLFCAIAAVSCLYAILRMIDEALHATAPKSAPAMTGPPIVTKRKPGRKPKATSSPVEPADPRQIPIEEPK
jgi:hypothetical protein